MAAHSQVLALMHSAETLFPGKSGAKKKKWVVDQLMDLKRSWGIDIPILAGATEDAVVRAILNAVIEVLWGMVFAAKDPAGA